MKDCLRHREHFTARRASFLYPKRLSVTRYRIAPFVLASIAVNAASLAVPG
jgi:hypothetical protein